jgi:hypothetical protein
MAYGEAPKGDALIAQIQASVVGQYTFELYPELWATPRITEYYRGRQWTITKFSNPPVIAIPAVSGIYMFVVAPCCGELTDHSYIFYVGQTKNLKERYKNYLSEQVGLGTNPRPKVVRFLSHLKEHVYFHFTEIPEDELDEAEDLLKDNLTPPANDRKTIMGRLNVGESA